MLAAASAAYYKLGRVGKHSDAVVTTRKPHDGNKTKTSSEEKTEKTESSAASE